jgi:uncharacterized membrane-anchored protein YhcB (DUF1043 family)
MTWQEPAVIFIVGAAVGYLVWKLGLDGRPKAKKRGPDVRVSALTRKKKR